MLLLLLLLLGRRVIGPVSVHVLVVLLLLVSMRLVVVVTAHSSPLLVHIVRWWRVVVHCVGRHHGHIRLWLGRHHHWGRRKRLLGRLLLNLLLLRLLHVPLVSTSIDCRRNLGCLTCRCSLTSKVIVVVGRIVMYIGIGSIGTSVSSWTTTLATP